MNAEVDLYDTAAKSDPPATRWEKAGEAWGKDLGALADPGALVAIGAGAVGATEFALKKFGAEALARTLATPQAKLAGSAAGLAIDADLQRRKQEWLDYFNERN